MKLSNGHVKRLRLFKRFSRNLDQTLEYHEMCAAIKIGDSLQRIDEEIYVCPLCGRYYNENSIYSAVSNPTALTLEHNPPKNLNGSANLLTCVSCNNTNGSTIDTLVSYFLTTEDYLEGKNDTSIPARYEIGGHVFNGKIGRKQDMNVIVLSQKSNPMAFSKLIANGEIQNLNSLQFNITLPDRKTLCRSLLKIAHLTAFRILGYSYLLNSSGVGVMKVLQEQVEYPVMSFGVLNLDLADSAVGVNVINEPSDLKSLLVVEKLQFEGNTRNIGIVLPGPDEEGWKRLENFNHYKKQNVAFSLTKYEFKEILSPVDTYYDLFGL